MKKILFFAAVILICSGSTAFAQAEWVVTNTPESEDGWMVRYTQETKTRLYTIDVGKENSVPKISVNASDLTPGRETTFQVLIIKGKGDPVVKEYRGAVAKICSNQWSYLYGEVIGLAYSLPDKIAKTIREARINTTGTAKDCTELDTSKGLQ